MGAHHHEPPRFGPPTHGDQRRWLFSLAIALGLTVVAGIAAAVIGMSGPDVAATGPTVAPAGVLDGGTALDGP